jgi:ABC-type Fe3+ transport system substrate-binding protein
MAMRLTLVSLGLALASALSIASPAAAQQFPADERSLYEAAKKEGTVVWYESAPLEPMKAIALEFEKKYPGIKVEVLRIAGVQQYQRFMEEVQAKRHNADVLAMSDQPSVVTLINDKHVADWKIPAHNKYPDANHIKTFAYANTNSDIAIVYNTNKVKPEEVELLREWKNILDPRFKGRFAVTTMKCGVCYAPIHMFLDSKMKGEYGEKFLRDIAAQGPVSYPDVIVALDRVVAGEQDFALSWEAPALTKWQQGAPIRWVFPKPIPSFPVSFQFVSPYAPHPNAARLFQNWSLGEEGAQAFQKLYGAPPILKGVADTRVIGKESWYKPAAETYSVDFDRWDRDFHKDMDGWIRILRSAKQ